MADLERDGSVDPDAQAAVTDFLDYTEYLPADLIRSFTLIRGLDETYLTNTSSLNDLTRLYASQPSLPPNERPDPQELRAQISSHLDYALNARESAYAEACRLYDVVDRHQNRLKSILAKLNAIPKPPSRDPTPPPPTSPHVKRSRSGRKLENSTRLTLHPPRGNAVASAILKRPRGRRVTVPGEVMPPYDPDSPIASTEVSDWESPPPSPPRPVLKLKQPKAPAPPPQQKEKTKRREDAPPRVTREVTEPFHKPTPPPEDAPIGSKYRPWTHLTEFELYKLRKRMKKNNVWEPSEIMIRRELAERGRGWENYYRAKAEAEANGTVFYDLDSTERSLPDTLQSPEKDDIVANTVETTVETTVEKKEEPEKIEKLSNIVGEANDETQDIVLTSSTAATPTQTQAPKPRTARKSESRKEKRPDPARSQAALAAQEAELAARRLGDMGSKIRNLFTAPFASALASLNRSTTTPSGSRVASPAQKVVEKTSKKRKAEHTPTSSLSPSAEPDAARKKQKTVPKPSPLATSPQASAITTANSETPGPATRADAPSPVPVEVPIQGPAPAPSAGTIKIPLKLTVSTPAAARSNTPTPAPTTRAASVQRTSVAPKTESTTPIPSRPPSRRSTAASVEPQQPARSSHRASTTPSVAGHKTPAVEASPKSTAASRRSKRDAPGTVMQSSQDGGAAVSVSKRKTKPGKHSHQKTTPKAAAATTTETVPQIRIDTDGRQEIIDPDEERYCVCGDVSWGEMICCELDEKVRFILHHQSDLQDLYANVGCVVRLWTMVSYGVCKSSGASTTNREMVLSR
ncbi:hypothetical protein H2204_012167 [Knufia peltigerae]|uniref:Inhibitor of growth protein N-terminal histone-binding domain-containing protein n=1 Tax=Knufia peltigerae TaxID=1002370 RepID=A0AA38XU50_9EURO|nr:hypothetical protein H2204_012167 [Knufia peltigerae]